jgi:hypothetical protein
MILNETEKRWCEQIPDILRALADYHDFMACYAQSQGIEGSVKAHMDRCRELKAEADRIDSDGK